MCNPRSRDPSHPVSDQRVVEIAQAVVSNIRGQSELLAAAGNHLQRAILDAPRYNVSLDLSDLVGRSGHNSDDDIEGAK